MNFIKTIEWRDDKVIMLDQRLLPHQEVYNTYEDYVGVARAIQNMVIRGAPAIGVAAAMGVALGALGIAVTRFEDFYEKISVICNRLAQTRPTAVNLFWALERMKKVCLENRGLPVDEIKTRLKEEAKKIQREDFEATRAIGRLGKALLSDGMRVLTHCNTGALATGGYGTALGIVYAANEEGKRIHVYADETRPLLQGSRLTAWELQKHGIEVTVLCDNMAAGLLQEGKIQCVLVGADRIATNGDVVNKIGTYNLAILAHYHKIPFYVAAPLSTIDMKMSNASQIPIEERNPQEVTHMAGQAVAPAHVQVINPAFDRTPANLVTAIITENGIAEFPFEEKLKAWKTD